MVFLQCSGSLHSCFLCAVDKHLSHSVRRSSRWYMTALSKDARPQFCLVFKKCKIQRNQKYHLFLVHVFLWKLAVCYAIQNTIQADQQHSSQTFGCVMYITAGLNLWQRVLNTDEGWDTKIFFFFFLSHPNIFFIFLLALGAKPFSSDVTNIKLSSCQSRFCTVLLHKMIWNQRTPCWVTSI